MIVRNSIRWGAGMMLALSLVIAQSAAAQPLSMIGEWFMNRGPLVDIPANGGPVFCNPVAPDALLSGCVGGLRPLNGGIPADLTVVTPSGSNPAKFTIPDGAFALAGGAANRQTVPVNGIPTVIQLASQFSLLAPAGLGTAGTGIVPGGAASFQANARLNDPVQVSGGAVTPLGNGGVPRLADAFTWCPPNGVCATTILTGTPPTPVVLTKGIFGAQIKYTNPNPNKFGGTMNMMLRDTGVVSIAIGGGAVLHQLVGGISNPDFGKQAAGGGYANYRKLTLADGPVHAPYTIPNPCVSGIGEPPSPPGCGIITNQGPQVNTLPGSKNYDWGMPWTTGTVQVQNLAGPAPSKDPATTFTLMGADNRTALGAGRITMVAGATTERSPTGNHFAAIEVLNLRFGSTDAVPLSSWPSFAVMIALLTLAGGYMARRHFAGEA